MTQLAIDLPLTLPKDAYAYGQRTSGEVHGVVLTKPHVVDLILDLAGYTADKNLASLTLLEPSCGHGAFLVKAVERLVASARSRDVDVSTLANASVAYDIDPTHVARSREAVVEVLRTGGIPVRETRRLAQEWTREGDFLLSSNLPRFDAVVGNPPYIRIEQIAPTLQAEYRARFASIYDRADLYVAFIEHGLNLLRPDGILSFVCADRWTLNRYGAPLRQLVSERFRVRAYIDLHQASPFDSEVAAYPAIFALSPGRSHHVVVAKLDTASAQECEDARDVIADPGIRRNGVSAAVYDSWFEGSEPWTLTSPKHIAALRDIESRFHPIESDGRARVGIGVATGNDKLYIVGEDADIESDRLVPLAMRDDIERGKLRDARRYVINAFADVGGVVDLRAYPRLAKYFESHAAEIKERHVAKSNPASWFRTIDRVYPSLVAKPKLLIPDIAGANEVAFDAGRFHPHHNLYFITSESWDMEALGALLSSRVALFFIWSYAVKMRGGYLRFQAQYLRRIRLPDPRTLDETLLTALARAFQRRDFGAIDKLALEAFGLRSLPEFEFVDTRA